MKRLSLCALILSLTLLTACAPRGGSPASEAAPSSAPSAPATSGPAAEPPSQAAPAPGDTAPAGGESYIQSVAAEVASRIMTDDMTEYDRAKAAFDYMIANTSLAEPVGLDLWLVRGDGPESQPPYVENRALSALLFGIGMCEDYAAAFTVLLDAMGLEARYVPGLTYSAEGFLVDHAWTVAKIDGVWYHLDSQLEDNISRHGAIRYRYFMKGDSAMAGSHRWGRNLIDSRLLTEAQNAEIAENYIMPPCPEDYPAPPRQTFTPATPPDRDALALTCYEEVRDYEAGHGPLPRIGLNITPPVFGTSGYGPED